MLYDKPRASSQVFWNQTVQALKNIRRRFITQTYQRYYFIFEWFPLVSLIRGFLRQNVYVLFTTFFIFMNGNHFVYYVSYLKRKLASFLCYLKVLHLMFLTPHLKHFTVSVPDSWIGKTWAEFALFRAEPYFWHGRLLYIDLGNTENLKRLHRVIFQPSS